MSALAENADAKPEGRSSATRLAVAVAALVLLTIVGVSGYAVYRDRIAPFQTDVLIVDDTRIGMDYFVKRVRMSGQPPLSVLQALTFEEIVKSAAPAPPYSIAVSDADIDAMMREDARAGGAALSDAEFAEWQRQQLNESGLTQQEFRELTRVRLLMHGMRDHFAAEVPESAEQVRLGMIAFPSRAEAEAAKQRLDAGAGFEDLARELNADPELKAKAGDIGWHARPGLAPNVGRIVFDLLKPGEPSDPVTLGQNTFALLMVSGKDARRKLEPEDLKAAQAAAFDDWIAAEFRTHHVEYHGFENGFDSRTDAWVREQVAQQKAIPGSNP